MLGERGLDSQLVAPSSSAGASLARLIFFSQRCLRQRLSGLVQPGPAPAKPAGAAQAAVKLMGLSHREFSQTQE